MVSSQAAIELALDSPAVQDGLRQSAEGGYAVGYEKGFEDALNYSITWLEQQYLDAPDRPDRGSPEANALLDLAKRLAKYLNKKRNEGRISQKHAAEDLKKFLASTTKKPAKKATTKKAAAK